jgi:ribosomal protein S18 acetylase RimI-like enzyme
MIKLLDHRQREIAERIQTIQKPAYKVEARLMEFDGIPQIHESVEAIQNCEEVFIGFTEEELKGFISFKKDGQVIDIHRLVVDPPHFRRGIARKLLAHLLEQYRGYEFEVSTGSANEPAKNLYGSFGFIEQGRFEVAPGITCSKFLKRK